MRSFSRSHRRRHEPSIDGLPEQMAYHDTGCEVSSSCLTCPLPRCKFDDPVWYQQYRRSGRDRQVLAAFEHDGLTVFDLARRFEVSTRTIHRVLRRATEPVALSA